MRRLCIIGDSHLAAVKLGWNVLADEHSDVLITFFGAPGATLADARIDGGRLVADTPQLRRGFAMTSGGDEHIQLDAFDAFAVVGLRVSLVSLVRTIYSRYRSDAHSNLDGPITLVGEAAFFEMCRRKLASSIGYRIAGQLRNASAAQVMVVPQPLPSDLLLDAAGDEFDAPIWKAAVASGDDAALDAVMVKVIDSLATDRIEFLSPPAITRSGRIFTKREYSGGSVRLSEGFDMQHPANDHAHMNANYGREVMRAMLRAIATASSSGDSRR